LSKTRFSRAEIGGGHEQADREAWIFSKSSEALMTPQRRGIKSAFVC